jgi:hypothetical protein
MAEEKNPFDQLLDLCVFGPIGLLVAARAKYPALVEQGRQQLMGHAQLGRFAAQFAASRGKKGAAKAIVRLRQSQAGASADGDEGERWPVDPDAPMSGGEHESAHDEHSIAEEEVIAVRHEDDDPNTAASVGADELAIPSYDSLAASQVVQRLEGLTADELEAVRRYELAHRARKTVLGKVAQLQRHP